MYYVYILKSGKDGKLYFGFTANLKKRIFQHNLGMSKSTVHRRPLKLVYYEAFTDKEEALSREGNLKKFKKTYSELKKRIMNCIDN